MIQESALHTYSSALAFTPASNALFQNYRNKYVSNMPRITSTVPLQWTTQNVLSGHTEILEQVTFSPDGSRLVTIARDRSLILWDTNSGAIVGNPFNAGKADSVRSASFSTDSQRLVFATKSSKIHVWSASTATKVGPTMEAESEEMVQVAFVGSWQQILSASEESENSQWRYGNNLQLWSTSTGQRIGQTMQLNGGARYFSVSPDGSRVVCLLRRRSEGETIGPVTFWNLDSFTCLAEFDMPYIYHYNCTRYSPTANRWVTWDQRGTLYLRDGVTGDRINHIKAHKDGVMAAEFSLNGEILASFGRGEHTILVWDAVTGALVHTLSGHTDTVHYISFAQDGTRMASISSDQTVRVWDVTTGGSMDSFFPGYIGNVDFPTLSPDWSKFVTISASYQINLHDIVAGTMHGNDAIETNSLDFSTPHVAFSPAGDVMVCGYTALNDTSRMDLWRVETCTRMGIPMTDHDRGILCVAFSPDAHLVASVAEDNKVRLWDGSTGSPIGTPLHIHEPHHVVFSPDSGFVASSGYYETKVWEVRTEECVWSIASGGGKCAFSSSSTYLSGESESKLCLWDFISGSTTPIASTPGPVQFNALAFDHTDTLLASSSSTIRLWNVADELQLLAEIPITPNSSYRLGISIDSRLLAYGWFVWDISNPNSPISLSTPGKSMQPLNWKMFPNSLLAYDDGWIYSASPPGRLMPVPRELWSQFSDWHAHGNKVVIWNQQRLPTVIDCEPLLS
jgi:WD40 repeat protein